MSPYSSRILELFLLKQGGYPFGPDELELADRMILGAIEIAFRRMEMADAIRGIFRNKEEKGD